MTANKASLWDINKRIFVLALPMAGIQLIAVASSFFCMTMLAHLGSETLAASALVMPTQMSLMMIGMAILFSMSILIGREYGRGNALDIGSYVQQGWLLSLFLSIPTIIVFWNIGNILILFGQSKSIALLVQTYFRAYVWGVVPSFLAVCNQQLCYGINKQRLAILASFLSVLVLMTTAHFLIFGNKWIPPLGIAGLGYASAAQSAFYTIFTFLYFYYDAHFKSFQLFQLRLQHTGEHLLQMLKLGWPFSIHMGGELLSLFMRSAMVGWLGLVALGAYQVINQYIYLTVIPVFALSQASGILIGQAYGAKKIDEIKKLAYTSFVVTLMFTCIVAVGFFNFPLQLASLYLNVQNASNTEILRLVAILFAIVAFSQIFDGIRNIFTGSLRGLLDSRFPMYASFLSLWIIGLPLSYLLGIVLHWGVVGISWGSVIGMMIGAMIVFLRWKHVSGRLTDRAP